MATGVTLSGKDLLEPRLATLCMNAGVDEAIMDIMGKEGLNTCALIKGIVSHSDEFRDMMKEAPFGLNGTDFATKLKIGKITTVYESCLITTDVANKADAERILQNRPRMYQRKNWQRPYGSSSPRSLPFRRA